MVCRLFSTVAWSATRIQCILEVGKGDAKKKEGGEDIRKQILTYRSLSIMTLTQDSNTTPCVKVQDDHTCRHYLRPNAAIMSSQDAYKLRRRGRQ